MYLCVTVSVWIALPLSLFAAGFLVRIFIIQHDCGHGSFFRSRRANDFVGNLCSVMTLTPYAFWRRQHARHHGSWNNLDHRAQSGLDIYSSCMTVAEYRALTPWRRRLVRVVSYPAVANLLLPPFVFILLYRIPFDAAKGWRRERRSVIAATSRSRACLALCASFSTTSSCACGAAPDDGAGVHRGSLALLRPAPL